MDNIIHIPNMDTLDLWSELYTIEQHLSFTEQQIEFLAEQERMRAQAAAQIGRYHPNDAEYQIEYQHFYHLKDTVLPRIFRNSFLVSLWSVYESSISDLADLFRDRVLSDVSAERRIRLSELSGGFLKRANRYYTKVLDRQLVTSHDNWTIITMLYGLRNAIVHAAGRMDTVSQDSQKQIIEWSKRHSGIEARSSYLIVSAEFAKEMHDILRHELEVLIRGYEHLEKK